MVTRIHLLRAFARPRALAVTFFEVAECRWLERTKPKGLAGGRNAVVCAGPTAGGRIYPQVEPADCFDAHKASGQAVDHAYAAWRAAVLELKRMDALAKVVLQDLRNAILGFHGRVTRLLGKKAELTVEQKQLAAARRLETRKLRRTMGRRQKLEIKAAAPVPAEAPATERPAESPNVGSPEAAATAGGTGGDGSSE